VAINKQDLFDLLYDNLRNYSQSDAYKNNMKNPQHMKVIGDTMQDYFEENLEITYDWEAYTTSTPSSTDPVTSFQSTVKFSPWDLSKPMTLIGLATKIMNSVATGVISHPVGFSVTTGSFLILPLVLPQYSKAAECLMKCIVEPVCNWILTLINTAPLSGSHGAFIGATTSMTIE